MQNKITPGRFDEVVFVDNFFRSSDNLLSSHPANRRFLRRTFGPPATRLGMSSRELAACSEGGELDVAAMMRTLGLPQGPPGWAKTCVADLSRLLDRGLMPRFTPRTLVIGVAASFKRPLWRGLAGIGSNLVSNLFLARAIPLQLTTFCAFRRELCGHLDPHADLDFALVTELVQAADHVVTVAVQSSRSTQRTSRYTLRTLLRLFLSRSRCYSPTRVLIGLGVSLALTAAAAAFAVTQNAPAYLLIAGSAAALSAMLAWLAIKVRRDQRAPRAKRCDRQA